MSTTLLVRHLCSDLSPSEREDFLRHFGAQKVWFINSNGHTAFASFTSIAAAEEALSRLHQLEILGKRLTVEYAKEANISQSNGSVEKYCKRVKQYIDRLNSWNPSLNLLQPPPPSLKYKYPTASPQILFNMIFEMQRNEKFYIQTLHLMNKIGLDPPFHDVEGEVKSFIENCLQVLDIKLPEVQPPPVPIISSKGNGDLSSEESEMSSNEDIPLHTEFPAQMPKKRTSNVKRINKKPRLVQVTIPTSDKKSTIFKAKEVFDEMPLQEVKKIEVKVTNIQLAGKLPSPEDRTEVIGTIGKINPLPLTVHNSDAHNHDISLEHIKSNRESEVITLKELSENKISLKDMKSLPIFKNYHPGAPSMRLYIKNLAKEVDTPDIERIYKRYITDCDASELEMFSIRVMREGRMKGQAFVSLPSVELSQRAVSETNGFVLKNKPMVVQFARTAK